MLTLHLQLPFSTTFSISSLRDFRRMSFSCIQPQLITQLLGISHVVCSSTSYMSSLNHYSLLRISAYILSIISLFEMDKTPGRCETLFFLVWVKSSIKFHYRELDLNFYIPGTTFFLEDISNSNALQTTRIFLVPLRNNHSVWHI